MHKTAVVILNWDSLLFLKKFLRDVVRYSSGKDTRVYIADNGSTDGSAEWVADNFRNVGLIRMGENLGFAGGYNHALQQIDSEYFVLLNSDVEVTEGWLTPLVSFMDENLDVASCQPKIRSYNQKDHFEYAGAAGGFIDRYGFTFCRGRVFNVIEEDTGQYDNRADIFWSGGACMIVRSEVWKRCGGFDESFFAHMEEVDLCWRFHHLGYRVCYIPESVVYHVGGGTLSYNSPLKTYLNFRNNLFLLYKNLPGDSLHSTLLGRKIFDGMAALLFLAKGRFKSFLAVLRAHSDYYKSLPGLREKRKKINQDGTGNTGRLILNKSIVWEFYLRRHKTFRPWIN